MVFGFTGKIVNVSLYKVIAVFQYLRIAIAIRLPLLARTTVPILLSTFLPFSILITGSMHPTLQPSISTTKNFFQAGCQIAPSPIDNSFLHNSHAFQVCIIKIVFNSNFSYIQFITASKRFFLHQLNR